MEDEAVVERLLHPLAALGVLPGAQAAGQADEVGDGDRRLLVEELAGERAHAWSRSWRSSGVPEPRGPWSPRSSVKCPLAGIVVVGARGGGAQQRQREQRPERVTIFERMNASPSVGFDAGTITTARRARPSGPRATQPWRACARSSAAPRSIPGASRRPAQRSPTCGQARRQRPDGEGARIEPRVRARPRRAASTRRRSRWRARCRRRPASCPRCSAGSRCRRSSDRACSPSARPSPPRGACATTNEATIWQNSIPDSYEVPGRQRQEDVQPARARGLEPAGDAQRVELVVDPAGDVAHARERRLGHRVEIDRRDSPSRTATARARTRGPARSPPAAPCGAASPARRPPGAPARRRRCRPARRARPRGTGSGARC